MHLHSQALSIRWHYNYMVQHVLILKRLIRSLVSVSLDLHCTVSVFFFFKLNLSNFLYIYIYIKKYIYIYIYIKKYIYIFWAQITAMHLPLLYLCGYFYEGNRLSLASLLNWLQSPAYFPGASSAPIDQMASRTQPPSSCRCAQQPSNIEYWTGWVQTSLMYKNTASELYWEGNWIYSIKHEFKDFADQSCGLIWKPHKVQDSRQQGRKFCCKNRKAIWQL